MFLNFFERVHAVTTGAFAGSAHGNSATPRPIFRSLKKNRCRAATSNGQFPQPENAATITLNTSFWLNWRRSRTTEPDAIGQKTQSLIRNILTVRM